MDAPSSYHIKEVLIHWSIFGRGNPDVLADEELLKLYEGFQSTLTKVLPPSLGFRRFSIRNMEVVLECDTGEFMIDGASGGLSTLIDLAWQIYMYPAPDSSGFTVLIDEVENHLHPTMQRRVLSDFLTAFPQVRFVVTTHSPLIVNSVRDSAVYVLQYDPSNSADSPSRATTVASRRLDIANDARTASQILDEVLGVSSTMPLWAEEALNQVVDAFARRPVSEESFAALRQELTAIGLAAYLPQALGKALDAKAQ